MCDLVTPVSQIVCVRDLVTPVSQIVCDLVTPVCQIVCDLVTPVCQKFESYMIHAHTYTLYQCM